MCFVYGEKTQVICRGRRRKILVFYSIFEAVNAVSTLCHMIGQFLSTDLAPLSDLSWTPIVIHAILHSSTLHKCPVNIGIGAPGIFYACTCRQEPMQTAKTCYSTHVECIGNSMPSISLQLVPLLGLFCLAW